MLRWQTQYLQINKLIKTEPNLIETIRIQVHDIIKHNEYNSIVFIIPPRSTNLFQPLSKRASESSSLLLRWDRPGTLRRIRTASLLLLGMDGVDDSLYLFLGSLENIGSLHFIYMCVLIDIITPSMSFFVMMRFLLGMEQRFYFLLGLSHHIRFLILIFCSNHVKQNKNQEQRHKTHKLHKRWCYLMFMQCEKNRTWFLGFEFHLIRFVPEKKTGIITREQTSCTR